MIEPLKYEALGKCHPKLARNRVWCTTCGHTQEVDSGVALRNGWPEHCGYTMTIDSPEERSTQERDDG